MEGRTLKGSRVCGILSLPSEVLTAIFALLDAQSKVRVARVCRAWRNIVYHSSLWHRVELNWASRKGWIDAVTLRSIAQRGIRRLDGELLTIPDARNLREIARWFPHLEYLHFILSHYSVSNAVSLSPTQLLGLRRLKCLTELVVDIYNVDVNHAVQQIAHALPNLVTLEFRGYKFRVLHNASVSAILCNLLKLKKLKLAISNGNTDEAIKHLCNCGPEKFKDHARLNYLTLHSNDAFDQTFFYLCTGQQDLQHLYLQIPRFVTDVGFSYLAQMPHLTDLRLVGTEDISDAGFTHIASIKSLRKLHLILSVIGDAGVANLTKSSISNLALNCCHNVTDSGLAQLAMLSCLQTLDVCSCDGITAEGVVLLANGEGEISCLSIGYGRPITANSRPIGADGFLRILQVMPHLHTLGMAEKINDVRLVNAIRNLRFLKTFYYMWMTAEAPEHLGDDFEVMGDPLFDYFYFTRKQMSIDTL